jgi:hypothetical protein
MSYNMFKYLIVILITSLSSLSVDTIYSVHAEEIVCIPGDFDGDGNTDGGDLAVFASNFGRTDGTNLGSEWDFSKTRSLPHLSSDMISFQNVLIENKPYMVIMQSNKGRLIPISREEINTVEIPFHTITIDGDGADWAGIPPAVVDPEDDEHPNYVNVTGTDLKNVYMAYDNTYLYFRMTLHDGNPIAAQYVVEFQQYLTQIHTPGDINAYAQKEPGNDWMIIVGDRSPCGTITTYPADHVGIGSGMIEWKVLITDMQYPPDTPFPFYSPVQVPPGIENQFIRTYIHPYPYVGVSDSNDELTRPMIVNFYD